MMHSRVGSARISLNISRSIVDGASTSVCVVFRIASLSALLVETCPTIDPTVYDSLMSLAGVGQFPKTHISFPIYVAVRALLRE